VVPARLQAREGAVLHCRVDDREDASERAVDAGRPRDDRPSPEVERQAGSVRCALQDGVGIDAARLAVVAVEKLADRLAHLLRAADRRRRRPHALALEPLGHPLALVREVDGVDEQLHAAKRLGRGVGEVVPRHDTSVKP
jgi:hypothetical protein